MTSLSEIAEYLDKNLKVEVSVENYHDDHERVRVKVSLFLDGKVISKSEDSGWIDYE